MAAFVGSKILITVKEGTYEGIIQSLAVSKGRISLDKVVSQTTQKPMIGVQTFYKHEIHDIIVLEDSQARKISKEIDVDEIPGGKLLSKKRIPEHLKKFEDFDPSSLVMNGHACNNQSTGAGMNDRVMPGEEEAAGTYTVLTDVDDTFHAAIDHIHEQSIIGLAVEGIDIGRKGKLCWLQIGTKEHVFLFDILSLGKGVFLEKLGNIIESKEILKVMHDCRWASDLLYHQYTLKLLNVFDTQVAGVLVYRMLNGGDIPRYVQGIGRFLLEHLDVDVADVYMDMRREDSQKEDQSYWAVRPPSKKVLIAATKNVKHLRNLRKVLMEKMLMEFTLGVDIYLGIVRDVADCDITPRHYTHHLVPEQFQYLYVDTLDQREWFYSQFGGENDKGTPGFRENMDSVSRGSSYLWSHDSIWHKAPKNFKANCKDMDVARRRRSLKYEHQSMGEDSEEDKPVLSLASQSQPAGESKGQNSKKASPVAQTVPGLESFISDSSSKQDSTLDAHSASVEDSCPKPKKVSDSGLRLLPAGRDISFLQEKKKKKKKTAEMKVCVLDSSYGSGSSDLETGASETDIKKNGENRSSKKYGDLDIIPNYIGGQMRSTSQGRVTGQDSACIDDDIGYDQQLSPQTGQRQRTGGGPPVGRGGKRLPNGQSAVECDQSRPTVGESTTQEREQMLGVSGVLDSSHVDPPATQGRAKLLFSASQSPQVGSGGPSTHGDSPALSPHSHYRNSANVSHNASVISEGQFSDIDESPRPQYKESKTSSYSPPYYAQRADVVGIARASGKDKGLGRAAILDKYGSNSG